MAAHTTLLSGSAEAGKRQTADKVNRWPWHALGKKVNCGMT